MITGLLAGCLTAAVLSVFRLRADHRLRDRAAVEVEMPARLTTCAGRSRPVRFAVSPSARCARRNWHRSQWSPRRPARLLGARWRLPLRRTPRVGPAELAGWCDALAREIRTGASLGAALRAVAPPDGTTLATIPHALARGLPLADALAVTAVSPDEAAALTVLASCAHHGGPAARPLDQLAATLRRRAADAAERAVHSAQARLSALVMTVLPGAVLLLLLTTSPSVRSITTTRLGVTVVVAGLGLNVLGWLWMRRIIAGGQR